jgi:hypothetical protein
MNWQPIETAPKTGARVLTVRGNGYVAVMRHMTANAATQSGSRSWWVDDSNLELPPAAEPTHWMPLPEAPK